MNIFTTVVLIVVLCLTTTICAVPLPLTGNELTAFFEFQQKFGKVYTNAAELQQRAKIFGENLKLINKLNQENNAVYSHLTKFMDLTVEEFKSKYLMQPKKIQVPQIAASKDGKPYGDLPESYDWRDHNVVTPVKDQSSCGSCWAFSAIQAVESAWAISGKPLVELAPEQLVDCDNFDCGCLGGWPYRAYEWLLNNTKGGVASEKDYPYCAPPFGDCYPCIINKAYCGSTSYCNVTCNAKAPNTAFIKGYQNVTNTDEDYIAQYLMEHGPLSISMNAIWLQFYHSGISNPMWCPPDEIDHAVLLVGFGVHTSWLGEKEPYWIIKNSWGSSWGEKGYFRLARGHGKCGVNTMAVFPIVQ